MADIADHHDGRHHSVRFPDGQNESCNEIHVLKVADSACEFEVHAGFFKSDHKYQVEFTIPNKADLGSNIVWETQEGSPATIQSTACQDGEVAIVLHYFPNSKAGICKEYFTLKSDGKEIRVLFRAEILGREQGTPMLKDGVKCIERPHSASSMSSD